MSVYHMQTMVDSNTNNENNIRSKIKELEFQADLIDIIDILLASESFLEKKLLRKYISKPDIFAKIHEIIKGFLKKQQDFIKQSVDFSIFLDITPDDVKALKMLAGEISKKTSKKPLTNLKNADISTNNDSIKAEFIPSDSNPTASNNEQIKKFAYLLDPTSCQNIVGPVISQIPASHRIQMMAKIEIIRDLGDSYRAKIVGDNIEFSIAKDLVQF